MSSSPGINFDDVWKKFRRGERHDSLRDLIPATARRLMGRGPDRGELGDQEFWAVRNISFTVQPGEALGIIGPNGAGKSTTLKLLTRILRPNRGACQVRGRAGALIEVAAGFHPDLTGRENVFLQGAIMGMKRAMIRKRFDEIVEFAGITEFIDTQVKRYSSGMNARLGFAIAAHLDPDVMIIDEVLSVGDAAFQDKCVRHMHGMIRNGVPVVFVSHNLPAVVELCTKAIVITRGQVVFEGRAAEAVQQYRLATWNAPRADDGVNAPIRIVRVEFLEGSGEPSLGVYRSNADVRIRIHYNAAEPVHNPQFALDIHGSTGAYCYGTDTFRDLKTGTVVGAGFLDLRIPSLCLLPGSYVVSAGIHRGDGQGAYDLHLQAYPFSVTSTNRDKGVVALEHHWEFEHAAADGPKAQVPSIADRRG